jgi:sigma-B regulation protein RsbQ
MVFAHGFRCDQNMWRHVARAFEEDFRTVVFDNVGAGGSDLSAYSSAKYANLAGYASDVFETCRDLVLTDAIFVGHSVSTMVGVLASIAAPYVFSSLVLVGSLPALYRRRGVRRRIQRTTDTKVDNPLGWAEAMAPAIVGNPRRPSSAKSASSQSWLSRPRSACWVSASPRTASHTGRAPGGALACCMGTAGCGLACSAVVTSSLGNGRS